MGALAGSPTAAARSTASGAQAPHGCWGSSPCCVLLLPLLPLGASSQRRLGWPLLLRLLQGVPRWVLGLLLLHVVLGLDSTHLELPVQLLLLPG